MPFAAVGISRFGVARAGGLRYRAWSLLPVSRLRRHGTCPPLWAWLCLVLAGVVLVGLRLHAFELPLETDECNYAYIGDRLLAGDRLYVDVWDHQPFGVFALFAGVSALFGSEPVVFPPVGVGLFVGVAGAGFRAGGAGCRLECGRGGSAAVCAGVGRSGHGGGGVQS